VVSSESLPRSEYPRPQWRRADWLCLNGTWAFAFDDHDAGERDSWQVRFPPDALPGQITVPFPYQAHLSGIGERAVHPIVWYRRTLTVPNAWLQRRLLLHFGAADFRADVWLNGQLLGSHEGGYTPFTFDVTDAIAGFSGAAGAIGAAGENILVVRCEDQPSDEQPRGKQDVREHRPYWFAATTGLWQTVWLEPVGAGIDNPYLESCLIIPDLASGGFRLRPHLTARPDGLRITVTASLEGFPAGQIEMDEAGEALLTVSEQRLWSPDTPHLYDLRFRLLRGETVVDEVEAYAGLREIAIRGREILLNGRPVYQRQVLDQGYWPDGLYTAPSDAALRRDVELTKRLGFNGARKHQKVEDPRWLYWCDRLGLLVWDEMAGNLEDTPRARQWLHREWLGVVRRDANHPCVVAWVPFNESWGIRDVATNPETQAYVKAVVAATREIDPTRPVVDNSGWTHVDTDIADSHNYEPAAVLFLDSWQRFHQGNSAERDCVLRSWDGLHQDRAWYGRAYAKPLFAKGHAYDGQPIMVTEWGGFFLEGAGDVAPILRQRRGVEPDEAAFLARYAEMIAAFDSLPDLAGDCWTQLTDIEDEPNGLLTEDRQPKVDPDRIAEINRRGMRYRRRVTMA